MSKKHIPFFHTSKNHIHLTLSEDMLKNCILAIIGMACACLFANLLKSSLFSSTCSVLKQTLKILAQSNISKQELCLHSFSCQMKFFLLLFFFSCTNVWGFFYRAFLFYIGFLQGVLLSCCLFLKGFSGILMYFAFLFPQGLLLAPFYLCYIQYLEGWHHVWFSGKNPSEEKPLYFSEKKKQCLLQLLPLFIVSVILLFISSFLEGYVNLPLLRSFC